MTGIAKYTMTIPEQLKIHFCIVSNYCNFIFLTESPWKQRQGNHGKTHIKKSQNLRNYTQQFQSW